MTELFNRIADSYENTFQRMADKFTELAGYAPDDASDIGIRMKVLAGEVCSLANAIDWLKEQTFAQSATGERLELRAAERGVTRKPASAATGVLTFGRKSTALWYAVPIPAGTVCATSGTGAERYVTVQDAELPAASMSVEVPARAEKAGSAGNTEPGTVTALVTAPAAIESVTNAAAFSGGADAEGDESLRARLMDRWAEPATGTNAAWYRQVATGFDGIFSANVVPRANGAGTAAVYLGGEGEAPADDAVRRVREAIAAQREIGADVTVAAAKPVPVNVSCSICVRPGQNTFTAKVQAHMAIEEYFLGLGVGEPVLLSALTVRVLAAGFADDCTFTAGAKTVAADELAVAGTVNVLAV